MKMPFGKFRGHRIADLPDDYLLWLLDEADPQPHLRIILEQEYQRRAQGAVSEPTDNRPAIRFTLDQVPLMKRLVVAGFRSLAKTEHPDNGGDTRLMQDLNLLMDSIAGQLDAID